MNDNQCSELFEDVFSSGGGGCVRECHCGRTYFDGSPDGGWDWEEGELEKLRQKVRESPDRYFEQDGTVRTMYINGMEVVMGCSCGIAKKYEEFIIHSDEQIAKYLNKRAIMMREKADKINVPREIK